MKKQIHITARTRDKMNKINRKHISGTNNYSITYPPQSTHSTQKATIQVSLAPVQKEEDRFSVDEKIIGPVLDLFLGGVIKGNAMDKKTMDTLMETICYKMVSNNFYTSYRKKYEVALALFNEAQSRSSLFK
jgi:DNA-binding ferritin-like protein (Dps family)